MPVIVASSLLSVADLAAHLHSSGISAKDQSAAVAAVNFGVAHVRLRLGFDVLGLVDGVQPSAEDVAVVRGVALRVAAQWFTNPQDRASYSGPEGLNYTGSPMMLSKIMSEADRVTLEMVQLKYDPAF